MFLFPSQRISSVHISLMSNPAFSNRCFFFSCISEIRKRDNHKQKYRLEIRDLTPSFDKPLLWMILHEQNQCENIRKLTWASSQEPLFCMMCNDLMYSVRTDFTFLAPTKWDNMCLPFQCKGRDRRIWRFGGQTVFGQQAPGSVRPCVKE